MVAGFCLMAVFGVALAGGPNPPTDGEEQYAKKPVVVGKIMLDGETATFLGDCNKKEVVWAKFDIVLNPLILQPEELLYLRFAAVDLKGVCATSQGTEYAIVITDVLEFVTDTDLNVAVAEVTALFVVPLN